MVNFIFFIFNIKSSFFFSLDWKNCELNKNFEDSDFILLFFTFSNLQINIIFSHYLITL